VAVDVSYDILLDRAITLARKGTGFVEPNPRVGALVILDGEIVSEGWHREYRGPHAEIVALKAAGERARGADLLLTLEPCSTHGKTPPCTDAIIASGIRRVFFAVTDPNPVNAGGSRRLLEEAGIEVIPLERSGNVDAAEVLIHDFSTYLRGTLPWVILKWAMSADGKVATADGESRWISSEASRKEVHQERARADVVMVGRATAKVDDPELSVRLVPSNGHVAIRAVLDSGLHLDPTSKLALSAREQPTWVFHCAGPDADDRKAALVALGVRVIAVPAGEGGRLDPAAALALLRSEGYHRILVEGGPTVHGSLLTEGLADWARVYVTPLLLGGITAPGPVAGAGFPSLDAAVWLSDVHLRIVGESGSDFVIEGRIGNHRES
jgi:diaminohydroxyphosphoribosylaminopyrimidine deaminase/5-amino-6-(5-phosphoribosylamino)uracil reductase